MSVSKRFHWKILLICFFEVFLWLLLSLGYAPSPALASPTVSATPLATVRGDLSTVHLPTVASLFRFFRRQPKFTSGVPANTASAGRRGRCNVLNKSFVAFVPQTDIRNPLESTAVGFTTQLSPTLLVHFPNLTQASDPDTSQTFAELVIQQRQGDGEADFIQPVSLPIVADAGITEISLKKADIQLEPDQAYHWYLSIVCDPERPSRNPSVDAWIETISTEESQLIEAEAAKIASDQARVDYYLEQGIWHEPTALLAKLRCQESSGKQYTAELKELLSDLYSDNDELKTLIKNKVETQTCPTVL